MNRIDERDLMFSRMGYQDGSPQYKDYYQRNPDKEEPDRLLRSMPALASPATPTFNQLATNIIDGVFTLLKDMHHLTNGPSAPEKIKGSPADFSSWVSGLTIEAGAGEVRLMDLNETHYYSHRGRFPEVYGSEITDMLPQAIVFTVPMNPELIRKGPQSPELIGTALGYLDAAKVALALAYSIRQTGYRARAHIDGHYFMPLRKLAQDSGLGAIGRNGLLISEKYGPCVRLGAVDTDLPLQVQPKETQWQEMVEKFCSICIRCAENCPAISKAPWPGDLPHAETCYKRWRKFGTDCGICIASCPFTDGLSREDIKSEDRRKKTLEKWKNVKSYDKTPLSWCPEI